MKSKRFPDRVHVVRPPSEEYGGQPSTPQSMGDHTREIVKALAQISDKLKRSEVERVEILKELRSTKNALAHVEDKTDNSEKAYLSLEHKIKNRDTVDTELTARQARFEKSLKSTEEKLVTAIAGQAVIDQKFTDADTRNKLMLERIDEAVTHQTRFDRRLEAISQDKSRMLRKVERLEDVVTQTQDTLNAKAMVLLTDQSAGVQGALKAPDWYDANSENDNAGQGATWWKSPMRMQALGTTSMVVAALLTGWMINHFMQPSVPQIAVMDSASIAQLNTKAGTWEPVVVDNQAVPSARLSELGVLEDQKLSTRLAESAAPVAKPADQEVTQVIEEQPFDYTNDQQLLDALESNPEQLAENLNAIEPGVQEALDIQTASITPEQQEEVVASAPKPTQEAAALTTPKPKTAAVSDADLKAAFQQEPSVANAVRRDRGFEPLSDRATRDENLPKLLQDYEEQAIRGVASAQHDLAAVYTAGRGGVDQDFSRAAFWFTEAAHNNIPNAAYNLGVLYHQGLGVDQDLEKALYWYREASKNNHAEAQYNLGIAYIEGIGTEYNPQMAATFFGRSADAGIMEAAYNLGLIYENGLLGLADTDQALYWYKTAADQGSPEAQTALNQLAERLQIDRSDVDALVNRMRAIEQSSAAPNSSGQATYSNEQAVVAQVQERLKQLGLYPGPTDGIMGPKTADAIRTYQSESDLRVTGVANQGLLEHIMQR